MQIKIREIKRKRKKESTTTRKKNKKELVLKKLFNLNIKNMFKKRKPLKK